MHLQSLFSLAALAAAVVALPEAKNEDRVSAKIAKAAKDLPSSQPVEEIRQIISVVENQASEIDEAARGGYGLSKAAVACRVFDIVFPNGSLNPGEANYTESKNSYW